MRTMRRWLTALMVIGIGGYAAVYPDMVKAFYEDLYPSNPAKRQALELCFMQDHKFNRLEPDEREACYRRILQSLGEIPAPGANGDQANANLVDLQQAAGAGRMPRNDIRRLEQTQTASHSSH